MSSRRTAVVTGGTGFTGSQLVRLLVADDWDVTLVARATSSTSALGSAVEVVRVVRIDALGGAGDVAAAIDDAIGSRSTPPVVFSLATLRSCASLEAAASVLDANVRLPSLLAAALANRGGGRLITSASYMLERGGVAPSLFSASRGAVDPILDWAAAHANVRITTLAPASIYGPGDARYKVFAALLRAASTGEPIDMADRDRRLDLVYVEDAARAYQLAAAMPEDDESRRVVDRYDVSSGRTLTLEALVEHVEYATGRPIDARWGERTIGPSDRIDPPAAPTWVPGWSPRVPLSEGLRAIAETGLRSPVHD